MAKAASDPAAPAKPPSPFLALTELPRALFELGSLPWAAPLLASAPRGDGHPVLVLPGFSTSDRATAVLRHYLARLGYDVHSWDLGLNLGPRAIGREGEKLAARVKEIHSATGRKVSLVGWSLGGMMARVMSRRMPEAVRQVISLGSPFAGTPRATNVWRIYELLSGQKIDDPVARAQLREGTTPPPVPSTAIWSREDGIVSWRNCVEPFAANSDNIEVHGSHCGLAVNPAVLYAIADRLAQPEDDWRPFDRKGLMRAICYPSAGHN
ncbi:alpha/beta fold hydrolase [uncultured Sphingomonas sp.]|uniref:alpha/beta fold hydrolase n=1 Tax=unclassified Sphingomonas TaxID=196159 RepID=UPI0025D87013|nr:alpha/beta fold hydrolase [uncultured Sphingomonas sp.]